jgi:ATP-dependent exoDNAse (exonuclease V) beta subunit
MTHRIARLPADFRTHRPLNAAPTTIKENVLPEWNIDQSAEHIGTVIHRTLERIAKEGLEHWTTDKLVSVQAVWKAHCLQLGLPQHQLDAALQIISEAIQNTLSDERGRWILSPHTDHQSEFPLTLVQDNQIRHCILDRTFIDENNQRWIIDYKSSLPKPHQSPTTFLQEAHQTHASQLHLYAQAFSHLEQRPIQLALYFPRCSLYFSWEYSAHRG